MSSSTTDTGRPGFNGWYWEPETERQALERSLALAADALSGPDLMQVSYERMVREFDERSAREDDAEPDYGVVETGSWRPLSSRRLAARILAEQAERGDGLFGPEGSNGRYNGRS